MGVACRIYEKQNFQVFFFFLDQNIKKSDTERFRMIVEKVWKTYKKLQGVRYFCPPSALIGLII